MNDSEQLLQVEKLPTHIFIDAGVVYAVEGVSLYIASGEVVALIGESGCGKSMTAMSLMRLVRTPGRIISGEIRFKGCDLLNLSEPEMREILGGEMAMVFQDPMT